MKILNILLLILFWGIEIFPQAKVQPKKSVMDFITTVENYSKGYNRSNEKELFKSKNYSKEEALSLAKQYYKAKAEDPVGFRIYWDQKYEKFTEYYEKNIHNKNFDRTQMGPAVKEGIVLKIISSYYGKAFTEIIGIPWYLRFHVLDFGHGKLKTSTAVFGTTYLIAKVEDVIKGKDFFKEGDTIEINFLDNWLMNPNKQYEKNKSYFAGLREWDCYNGNCDKIALYVFPDKDDGIYPIENGDVVAPDNYFGIKGNMKWPEFKSEFVKKYILAGG
jgi:hypothetical protein